jgi:outer membrane protein insertion porin family/translocation and assembly module TamA
MGRRQRSILVSVLQMLLFAQILLVATACKEESGVKVERFSFTGTRAVSTKQLKTVLATQASSRAPWGTKRYFSREQFDADLKRIVAFYRDRGFPDARVASFDVALNPEQTAVRIAIHVEEGEPITVERVVYEGFEPLPERHRRALEQALPLRAGRPLDRALLQASREAALDELKDHGYPYAAVRLEETAGSGERQRVIALSANPGPLSNFGPIDVSGNLTVGENTVRRQLTFRSGRIFRQSALQDSQRRLYSQELFQFANVESVKTETQPTEIPIRVTVTEGKHRKMNLSFGYGTEERGRVELDWRHVNFLGGARTAGVEARYSSLDRGVRLNFIQPYIKSPRYSLGLSAQTWHADEPAFTLDTNGGRATLTRQFRRVGGPVLGSRPATTLSFGYAGGHESYTISQAALDDPTFRDELIALGLDPTTGKGSGTRSAIFFDGGRNTTDSLLDAHRGYVGTLHFEQAGRCLGGSYDYFEMTAEGRFYQSIGGRAVLAVQGRAGSIEALGPSTQLVPFFKRYFLGGATTLRGWGRFEVSPLSDQGLPIGGTSFMNFSAELRAPLWGNLGGVLFVDGGNVWTNSWDINLNELRYNVGPGLRYNTKIGPIRADLGYQLNPIPGLIVNGEPQPRRFRFHFSIGQAF